LRRVAVTGLGVVSPIGQSRDDFFDSLISARSGIGSIQAPFADQLRIPIAAQVLDFDPASHFPKDRLSQLDRFSQFSLVAARQAWANAGLGAPSRPEACGTYWSTGLGGAQTLEAGYEDLFVKHLNRVKPMSVIACMPNAAAANMAIEFGLQGPCYTYTIACASSAVAVGEAFRAVSSGSVDLALTGGAEAFLTLGILKAWEALMTLAVPDKLKPETSCRPFAKDRTGFVPGEGAGALILEDYDHAVARGARILGEIVGYGISNDAHHLSRPEQAGQVRAMRMALAEANRRGVEADGIGYINAHGTATKVGDRVETESIKTVFGAQAARLPISSTKALHGHLMGAGGAIEFIATLLSIQRKIVPPTAHLYTPDPDCDLDYVPLKSRQLPQLRAAMSNSFAFGGSNAVLIAQTVA
jgi:beta-ketoacyl-acyl-carrier-protein synthase II